MGKSRSWLRARFFSDSWCFVTFFEKYQAQELSVAACCSVGQHVAVYVAHVLCLAVGTGRKQQPTHQGACKGLKIVDLTNRFHTKFVFSFLSNGWKSCHIDTDLVARTQVKVFEGGGIESGDSGSDRHLDPTQRWRRVRLGTRARQQPLIVGRSSRRRNAHDLLDLRPSCPRNRVHRTSENKDKQIKHAYIQWWQFRSASKCYIESKMLHIHTWGRGTRREGAESGCIYVYTYVSIYICHQNRGLFCRTLTIFNSQFLIVRFCFSGSSTRKQSSRATQNLTNKATRVVVGLSKEEGRERGVVFQNSC